MTGKQVRCLIVAEAPSGLDDERACSWVLCLLAVCAASMSHYWDCLHCSALTSIVSILKAAVASGQLDAYQWTNRSPIVHDVPVYASNGSFILASDNPPVNILATSEEAAY